MIAFTQPTRKSRSSFLSIDLTSTSWWWVLNMVDRGWWHRMVQAGRLVSQDSRDARKISMIVVSFTNYAWRFGFGRCDVWIFTKWCMVAPLCDWLLLLLLPFLLLSYWVFSITSFTKRRGGRRGRNKWSRRWGSNSSIISLLIWLLRNYGVLNDRGRE